MSKFAKFPNLQILIRKVQLHEATVFLVVFGGFLVLIPAGAPAILTKILRGFSSPSRHIPVLYIEISHDRFLPDPFNFTERGITFTSKV
jgi:hypothetical protein